MVVNLPLITASWRGEFKGSIKTVGFTDALDSIRSLATSVCPTYKILLSSEGTFEKIHNTVYANCTCWASNTKRSCSINISSIYLKR